MINEAELNRVLGAAAKAQTSFRLVSRSTRSALLLHVARAIEKCRPEFVDLLIKEAQKPRTLAEAEVNRAIITFTTASEEVKRFGGELLPIDIEPSARTFEPAVVHWVPRGVVFAVTPFNFPLNLVAHKVAPALASGNVVVLKPAPATPGPAYLLTKLVHEAAKAVSDSRDNLDSDILQCIECEIPLIEKALKDSRVATVSFTGSVSAGWSIQTKASGKRVLLELGGNAGVIVHADADLERAAVRSAFGGYAYAGQSCISVQRIFVQETVAPRFKELFLRETQKTVFGDPSKKETICGPLINAAAADRVMAWIGEATANGAKLLHGGKRNGNIVEPSVLEGVPKTAKLSCEEVFGPVVILETYRDFSEALARVNDSKFGLQAGVFTDSAKNIHLAVRDLEVGGVVINEVPTYRADQMPYGGVKQSGLGREGLRYAMEECSERKVVLNWVG